MAARVRRGESHQCGARVRVEMRRPLSHQVRRPQHAIRAGGYARRPLRSDRSVRIAAIVAPRTELIAEPPEREPGALRDAHDVPASRHRVAERVDASAGIERRSVRCREHDAGRADRCADRARADDAHADRSRRLVASACDDRRPGA